MSGDHKTERLTSLFEEIGEPPYSLYDPRWFVVGIAYYGEHVFWLHMAQSFLVSLTLIALVFVTVITSGSLFAILLTLLIGGTVCAWFGVYIHKIECSDGHPAPKMRVNSRQT